MTKDDARYDSRMSLLDRPLLQRLAPPRDKALPTFRETPRIIAILVALATHRALSAEQIARSDGGSARVVRHILKLLTWHGLVRRPEQQHVFLSTFARHGNVPLIYTITRKGMRTLARHGIAVDPRLDYTTKNAGSSALFLAHQLAVSETMLTVRFAINAARADCRPRLTDHHELLDDFPDITRTRDHPFRLSVTVMEESKPLTLTIVPDRLFRLANSERRWNFALELDRGTEVLLKRSKKLSGKSSFAKKLVGYSEAWREDRHRDTWGFDGFRVLTITTGEPRLLHMLELQRRVAAGAPSSLFLYSSPERIARHGILGPAWTSIKTDGISLLPKEHRATEPSPHDPVSSLNPLPRS